MTEWLKVRAWKVRMLQKGIVGSNPAFSAKGSESGIRKEFPAKRSPEADQSNESLLSVDLIGFR